jgi:hypothetical protein
MNLSALLAGTIAMLEHAGVRYIDRWVADLGLRATWSRARVRQSAD